ncbi:C40 family peptidase [Jatrophihabitans sp. DSM 45814]
MSRRLRALLAVLCAFGIASAVTVTVLGTTGTAAGAATANPVGYLDSATIKGAVVSYSGWAVDPSVTGVVRVVVTLDRVPVASALANGARPDVAKSHPAYGPNRGFKGSLTLPAGRHGLCFIAGNLAAGADFNITCKGFVVPRIVGPTTTTAATWKPTGNLDAIGYTAKTRLLSVQGWTLDPGTWAATDVDLMINGRSYGSALANKSRPDLAARYRGYGPYHGFAYTMQAPLPPGNYLICAVAINTAAGGNTILPCRMLSVAPVGDPESLNVALTATAAAAIQAQAIKTGAARAASFPATANSATRISIATRALLDQAAGRIAKPPAVKGIPAFVAATPAKAVDEQAVMGATQSLGTYPASKTGGRAGASRSLQVYANDSVGAPGGAGVGLIGAAPVLAANGKTVHPALPGYPAGYRPLRAQVAIDAALAHIGDPYVWAAAGPTTFDCSGLTQWAWAKAGVSLTHYTGSQAVQGVRVGVNQLLPGDLVLFGSDLHHVGMYLGAGYMLDAPDTGAYVRVDKISWFGDFSLAVRP